MAYNDNRDILSWKRLIDNIQTNDKLGVVKESLKEGGVHKLRVDQQTHITAEHHDVVVSSNDMGIIVDIYNKKSDNIDTNTYWNDDVMESKKIKEGTWSVPETPEQVKKLTNLLKNPLDAETALDELYDVFGDDELFDDLEVMKREEPETDVRHVVISRLKDMNFIKEVRENTQFNEGTYKGYDIKRQNRKDGHPLIVPALKLTGANMKDIKRLIDRHLDEEVNESLASTTDDLSALEELVMSYWDSLPENMQDELKTFWDEPRDTDEIKPFDESEEDGASAEDLVDIIMHRIKQNKKLMLALLGDEGPGPLMNAVEDVAAQYSGTTEVGSSDVSAMVDAVKRTLFPLDYRKFDSEPYGVEEKQVNELEDDGTPEYGDTEDDLAKALGITEDDLFELAERIGIDQYGGLTKDNYEDVMTHIVDNFEDYKQINTFRKSSGGDDIPLRNFKVGDSLSK